MCKNNPLTCIKLKHNCCSFVALVDGGSTVSCISFGLVKALGLAKFISYEEIKAKSWNSDNCSFLGCVTVCFTIGSFTFKHNFLVAKS